MTKEIEIGDIVGRISHGSDILFKVIDVREEKGAKVACLRGLDLRLFADAPLDDLVKKNPSEISKIRQNYIKKKQ